MKNSPKWAFFIKHNKMFNNNNNNNNTFKWIWNEYEICVLNIFY